MDMHSGKVVWVDGAVVGVEALCELLEKVRQAYSQEQALVLIWDNWPVHYHEKVLTRACELNIHLLWLPTYAPWTNPIEKLWRWLKQEHLHNHQLAEQFSVLKDRVRAFLDNFLLGSVDLLRYCGLATPIT
jgi:transposase